MEHAKAVLTIVCRAILAANPVLADDTT